MKNEKNNTESNVIDGEVVNNDNETGMVVSDGAREIVTASRSQFAQGVPLTREALEIIEEFQDLAQAVEAGFAEYTQPTILAERGVVLDIVDAWLTDFVNEKGVEEKKICFSLVEQETGVVHTVMQSDDSKGIRRRYAKLFSRSKALGIPTEPLRGYMFVATEKTFTAGNHAYILQRAPLQLQARAS